MAPINQRNITLALPFSAKAGILSELLVTESDGKLALRCFTPRRRRRKTGYHDLDDLEPYRSVDQ